MIRHVILVGLPGAGKTTVGCRAAEILSTEFTDIDEEVEAATGRSIAAIFADPAAGEPEFRRLERAAMDRALGRPPQLIAAGAGWIAQPGNLETASDALVVYLQVSAAVAAARVGSAAGRPLLAGGDPARKLEELLEAREPWYSRAAARVDASADPETVAARVAEVVRQGAMLRR